MEAAVKSRPDWCISRQRSWGVPLPAFYDAQGRPILDARTVRQAAALIEQHGSNVWFEKTTEELWNLLRPGGWVGPKAVSKSSDTLDVWIDSGSSSRAVLMRRPELGHAAGSSALPWQADMYFEGSDQHRGWFQSSLLLSLGGNGAAPYRTVLTHGFMVDADREKISKSKQGQGGYEKPQTAEAYIKKWGADIVRLWVASQDYRNDIVVSEERIGKVAETYRGIRNGLRYQLSNLYDFDPTRHSVPDAQLTPLDRWMVDAFARLQADVMAAYGAYEFHVVYQRISQFAAVELSSLYHDVVKDRLYTDPANSARRRSTQTALHQVLTGLCQLLSPILVFTSDEAWELIPGHEADSVHVPVCRPLTPLLSDAEAADWKRLFSIREQVLPALEQARQAKIIGKALESRVNLNGPAETLTFARTHQDTLRELLNVSQLELGTESKAESLAVEVGKASGQKCERCWHWETDIGVDPTHPVLCGRCVTAVRGANGAS